MGASLKLIKERITKSKHLQEQIRAHEFRDRSIAERNFERINFWSMVHAIVMIVAGLSQVMMIRSIFDEKSPVRKILFSKWYVCTNLITSVVGTKFSVWIPSMSLTFESLGFLRSPHKFDKITFSFFMFLRNVKEGEEFRQISWPSQNIWTVVTTYKRCSW